MGAAVCIKNILYLLGVIANDTNIYTIDMSFAY